MSTAMPGPVATTRAARVLPRDVLDRMPRLDAWDGYDLADPETLEAIRLAGFSFRGFASAFRGFSRGFSRGFGGPRIGRNGRMWDPSLHPRGWHGMFAYAGGRHAPEPTGRVRRAQGAKDEGGGGLRGRGGRMSLHPEARAALNRFGAAHLFQAHSALVERLYGSYRGRGLDVAGARARAIQRAGTAEQFVRRYAAHVARIGAGGRPIVRPVAPGESVRGPQVRYVSHQRAEVAPARGVAQRTGRDVTPPLLLSHRVEYTHPEAQARLAKAVGRALNDQQVARLAGAQEAGAHITVSRHGEIALHHADGSRTLSRIETDARGRTELFIFGRQAAGGRGNTPLSPEELATQIAGARALGLHGVHVKLSNAQEAHALVRMGFDARNNATLWAEARAPGARTGEAVPPPASVRGLRSLREVLQHPEGRAWWEQNFATPALEFRVGNRAARDMLEGYLRAQGRDDLARMVRTSERERRSNSRAAQQQRVQEAQNRTGEMRRAYVQHVQNYAAIFKPGDRRQAIREALRSGELPTYRDFRTAQQQESQAGRGRQQQESSRKGLISEREHLRALEDAYRLRGDEKGANEVRARRHEVEQRITAQRQAQNELQRELTHATEAARGVRARAQQQTAAQQRQAETTSWARDMQARRDDLSARADKLEAQGKRDADRASLARAAAMREQVRAYDQELARHAAGDRTPPRPNRGAEVAALRAHIDQLRADLQTHETWLTSPTSRAATRAELEAHTRERDRLAREIIRAHEHLGEAQFRAARENVARAKATRETAKRASVQRQKDFLSGKMSPGERDAYRQQQQQAKADRAQRRIEREQRRRSDEVARAARALRRQGREAERAAKGLPPLQGGRAVPAPWRQGEPEWLRHMIARYHATVERVGALRQRETTHPTAMGRRGARAERQVQQARLEGVRQEIARYRQANRVPSPTRRAPNETTMLQARARRLESEALRHELWLRSPAASSATAGERRAAQRRATGLRSELSRARAQLTQAAQSRFARQTPEEMRADRQVRARARLEARARAGVRERGVGAARISRPAGRPAAHVSRGRGAHPTTPLARATVAERVARGQARARREATAEGTLTRAIGGRTGGMAGRRTIRVGRRSPGYGMPLGYVGSISSGGGGGGGGGASNSNVTDEQRRRRQ